MRWLLALSLLTCGVLAPRASAQPGAPAGPAPAVAAPAEPAARPAVDPKADAVLKAAGQALASAKGFTLHAHAMADQVTASGQKIQVARNQVVTVRRPDGLAADVAGDLDDLRFWYDGKRVTVYNKRTNSVGGTDAPPTIDAALDMLATRYGLALPLADLLFADPYKTLVGQVRSGQYVGLGYVLETRCHHLAFRQESVDWQIWIEEGDKPLVRKVVITYKDSPGHPQYTALLSKWDLSAQPADATFKVDVPADAKKVEFGPAHPGERKE